MTDVVYQTFSSIREMGKWMSDPLNLLELYNSYPPARFTSVLDLHERRVIVIDRKSRSEGIPKSFSLWWDTCSQCLGITPTSWQFLEWLSLRLDEYRLETGGSDSEVPFTEWLHKDTPAHWKYLDC